MTNIVYEALLAGIRHKKRVEKLQALRLSVFVEDFKRHVKTPVNLPRYKCKCSRASCNLCGGEGALPYSEAKKIWGKPIPLSVQVKQCHICTRFETDDNPLFAYSYLENKNGHKFIYRCEKGHVHDHGMTFLDIHTGLEVHC